MILFISMLLLTFAFLMVCATIQDSGPMMFLLGLMYGVRIRLGGDAVAVG